MRSQTEYIITKAEVHAYAEDWLGTALRLEYQGYKCSTSTLLQILLIAAARVVSVFAACRDLADAPTDQTIRNALAVALPEIAELERRLNLALVKHVPKALRRKSRMVAIDLTLIPYHGRPALDKKEIFRGEPKSGTTHFHAYATAVVLHKGYRYTLALVRVEYGDSMKEVLRRLLAIVRRRGVQIRFLLLDKGFFSVEVMRYLLCAGRGFIIPAAVRRPKAQESEDPAARLASVAEEEKRLLPRDDHLGPNERQTENQRDREHLRCHQAFHPRGYRPTAAQAASLRGVESAANARRDTGTLSETFRHRDELPPNERGEDQNVYARSGLASAVRGHRPGVAQCVGVDSFSLCQTEIQRGAATVSRIASIPRDVVVDLADCATSPRSRQNHWTRS